MSVYVAKLTAVGLAKLTAMMAGGPKLILTTMCVDDGGGNPVSLDPVPSDLVHEVYSDQINALFSNPADATTMIAELAIPSSVGGFSMRGIGIRDADGDLYAYAKFPETYKPTAAEAGTRDMSVLVAIKVGNSANVELVIDTSIVIATRPWVLSMVTAAFLIPGGLTGQVLKKSSNADGAFYWADITDAVEIAIDVIKEPQTTVAAQTIYTLHQCTTDGVAVYIEGVRIFNFTVLNGTQLQLGVARPGGLEIVFVQNEPNEPLKLRRLVMARALYLSGH